MYRRGPHVLIFDNAGPVARRQEQCRTNLKLAALGYASARQMVKADPDLMRIAVASLCQAAVHYYEALTGKRADLGGAARSITETPQHHALVLAALAYASARSGPDAAVVSNAGLAALCQAAVRYTEALLGMLHLGGTR